MRSFLRTLFLSTGVLGSAALASKDQLNVRKSLAFSPSLPHAVFRSNPSQIQFNSISSQTPDADPLEVGRQFVEDLLKDQLSDQSSFDIRNDSYTDAATGASHIYVQQLINGLEVTNGKINVNVKDGVVLSYGDSFHRGSVPSPFVGPTVALDTARLDHPYWGALNTEVRSSILVPNDDTQIVFERSVADDTVEPLPQPPNDANCVHQTLYPVLSSPTSDIADPRGALLQFILAATPRQDVADDILARNSAHFSNMTSTFIREFTGSHESIIEIIENVPDAVSPVKATLAFAQVPHEKGSSLKLVWKFEVRMRDNWYSTTVSVTPPHKIISVVDWVSDAYVPLPSKKKSSRDIATYNVFAWGINDPIEGDRFIVKERVDLLASPLGWHSFPASVDPRGNSMLSEEKELVQSTTTFGNNVFAQEYWDSTTNWLDNYRPDAGESLIFDYPYNPQKGKSSEQIEAAKIYINATLTQLFYTVNMVHDLYYRYGFDEVSGNFQQYNFERNGMEGDAVIALAQDSETVNGAQFTTPPDGQSGTLSIYLWDTANPYRDGDMDAGIVIHELTHGLSNRLTGGPMDSDCLSSSESGGMGEGWGDFMAITVRSTEHYSDYPIGAWARNRAQGIRKYPYSLSKATNPSTYKFLDNEGYDEIHRIGEVWAEMLWIVSQRLIAKHGFSRSLFPPAPLEDGTIPEGDFYRPAEYTSFRERKPLIPKHGNSLMVQLVFNGMKYQPCNPSFFDARDAIIQADEILTGGENYCELWGGFSERGLGPHARLDKPVFGRENRTDDFEVPRACQTDPNASGDYGDN